MRGEDYGDWICDVNHSVTIPGTRKRGTLRTREELTIVGHCPSCGSQNPTVIPMRFSDRNNDDELFTQADVEFCCCAKRYRFQRFLIGEEPKSLQETYDKPTKEEPMKEYEWRLNARADGPKIKTLGIPKASLISEPIDFSPCCKQETEIRWFQPLASDEDGTSDFEVYFSCCHAYKRLVRIGSKNEKNNLAFTKNKQAWDSVLNQKRKFYASGTHAIFIQTSDLRVGDTVSLMLTSPLADKPPMAEGKVMGIRDSGDRVLVQCDAWAERWSFTRSEKLDGDVARLPDGESSAASGIVSRRFKLKMLDRATREDLPARYFEVPLEGRSYIAYVNRGDTSLYQQEYDRAFGKDRVHVMPLPSGIETEIFELVPVDPLPENVRVLKR